MEILILIRASKKFLERLEMLLLVLVENNPVPFLVFLLLLVLP